MKRKLIQLYSNELRICEKTGQSDTITIWQSADYILRNFCKKSRDNDIELE